MSVNARSYSRSCRCNKLCIGCIEYVLSVLACAESAYSVLALKLEGLNACRTGTLPNCDGTNRGVLDGNGLRCVVLNVETVSNVGHRYVLKGCGGSVYPVEAVVTAVNGYILHYYISGRLVCVQEAIAVVLNRTILNSDALDRVGLDCIVCATNEVHVLDDYVNCATGNCDVSGVLEVSTVDCKILSDRYVLVYICNKYDRVACVCSLDCRCKRNVLLLANHCYCNECIYIICNVAMSTFRTGVGGISLCIKRRCGYYSFVVTVSLCGNDRNRLIELLTTLRTLNRSSYGALSSTGCFHSDYNRSAFGVSVSGNLNGISAQFCTTYRTVGYVVVRTVYRTSGILVVFNNYCACGVSVSGNRNSLSAQFCITYRTVGYVVVRTVYRTGRSLVVLNNYRASDVIFYLEDAIYNLNGVVSSLSGCRNRVRSCYRIHCIGGCGDLDNSCRVTIDKSCNDPRKLGHCIADMDVLVVKRDRQLSRSDRKGAGNKGYVVIAYNILVECALKLCHDGVFTNVFTCLALKRYVQLVVELKTFNNCLKRGICTAVNLVCIVYFNSETCLLDRERAFYKEDIVVGKDFVFVERCENRILTNILTSLAVKHKTEFVIKLKTVYNCGECGIRIPVGLFSIVDINRNDSLIDGKLTGYKEDIVVRISCCCIDHILTNVLAAYAIKNYVEYIVELKSFNNRGKGRIFLTVGLFGIVNRYGYLGLVDGKCAGNNCNLVVIVSRECVDRVRTNIFTGDSAKDYVQLIVELKSFNNCGKGRIFLTVGLFGIVNRYGYLCLVDGKCAVHNGYNIVCTLVVGCGDNVLANIFAGYAVKNDAKLLGGYKSCAKVHAKGELGIGVAVGLFCIVNRNGNLCGVDGEKCSIYNGIVESGVNDCKYIVFANVYGKLAVDNDSVDLVNRIEKRLDLFQYRNNLVVCLHLSKTCQKLGKCIRNLLGAELCKDLCKISLGLIFKAESFRQHISNVLAVSIKLEVQHLVNAVVDNENSVCIEGIVLVDHLTLTVIVYNGVDKIKDHTVNLFNHHKAGVSRGLVIRVCYNTVVEVVAGIRVLNVVNEGDRHVLGKLSEGYDKLVEHTVDLSGVFIDRILRYTQLGKCLKVQRLNELVTVSIDKADQVCGSDAVLDLVLGENCLKPLGEVNVYVAVKRIDANLTHTAKDVSSTGDQNIVGKETFHGRTGFYRYGMSLTIVLVVAAGYVDGRIGKVDDHATNACTIVAHIAVFVIFNVKNDNLVYTCVYGSLVGEVRLTVGHKTCVNEVELTVLRVNQIALKVKDLNLYALLFIVEFRVKLFNLNLHVAGSDHNGSCDQITDIDLVIQNELNVSDLNVSTVGNLVISVVEHKFALCVEANELVCDLAGCVFVKLAVLCTECRCKEVNVLKQVAGEDTVGIVVVPLELNLIKFGCKNEEARVDRRIMIGVGYDRNDRVYADLSNLKVILKGKHRVVGQLLKRLGNAINCICKCVENLTCCALCLKSRKDLGKLFVKLVGKRANGYAMLSNVGSILYKDLIHPLGKVNVDRAVNSRPLLVGSVRCNTKGNNGHVGSEIFVGNRANSYLILGVVGITGSKGLDLILNLNLGLCGKNGDNTYVCTELNEIKNFVKVFDLEVFKIKLGAVVKLKVGCDHAVNARVYGTLRGVVELAVGLNTNVVNGEPLAVVCEHAVNVYVKALRLVVEVNDHIICGVVVLIPQLNVNRVGNNTEYTNDGHGVVELVTPQHTVSDLNIYAVVLNLRRINPNVSLDVAVDIYGEELAGIAVNAKHEVLDSKSLNVTTNDGCALIHSVPYGESGYVVINGSIPLKLNLIVLRLNNKVVGSVSRFVVRVNGDCAYDVNTHIGRMEILGNDLNLDINDIGDTGNGFQNLIEGLNRGIVKSEQAAKTVDKLGKLAKTHLALDQILNTKRFGNRTVKNITDRLGKLDLNRANSLAKSYNILICAKVKQTVHIQTDHKLDQLDIVLSKGTVCKVLGRQAELEFIISSVLPIYDLRIVVDRDGRLVNGYVNGNLARPVDLITCKEERDCVCTNVLVKILGVDLQAFDEMLDFFLSQIVKLLGEELSACCRKKLLKAIAVKHLTVIRLNLGCDTVIMDGNVGNNLCKGVLVISIGEADGLGGAVALGAECVRTKSQTLQLILNVRVSISNANLAGADLLNYLCHQLISQLFKVIFRDLGANGSPKLAKLNVKGTKLDVGKSKINVGKRNGYLTLCACKVLKLYLGEVNIGRILGDLLYDSACNRELHTVCKVIGRLILKNPHRINGFNRDLVVCLFVKVEGEGCNAVLVEELSCLTCTNDSLKLLAVDVYSLNSLALGGSQRQDVGTVTNNGIQLGRGIPVHCRACLVGYVNSRAGNGHLNGRIIGNIRNGNLLKGFLARLVVLGAMVGYNNSCIVAMIKNLNGVVHVVLNVDQCTVGENTQTHRLFQVFDQLIFLNVLNLFGGNTSLYVGCRTKIHKGKICLYCYRIVGLVIVGGIPCNTDADGGAVVEREKRLVGKGSPGCLCNVGGELNRPSTAVGCNKVGSIVLAQDRIYDLLCRGNLSVIALACLIHGHLSGKIFTLQSQNAVLGNHLVLGIGLGSKGNGCGISKGIANAAQDVIPVNQLTIAALKGGGNLYPLTANVLVNLNALNIRSGFGIGLVVELFQNCADIITRRSKGNGQSIAFLEVANACKLTAVSAVFHREIVLGAVRRNGLNNHRGAITGVKYVQHNSLLKGAVLIIGVLDADGLSSVLTKLVSKRTKVNCGTLGDILPQIITANANVSIFQRYVTGVHGSGGTVEDTAKYQSLQLVVGQIVIVHAVNDGTGDEIEIVLRVGNLNRVYVSDLGTVRIKGDGSVLGRIADLIGVKGCKCHTVLVNGDGFNNVGAGGLYGNGNRGVARNGLVIVGAVYSQATACGQTTAGNNRTVVQQRLHINGQGCATANPVCIALIRNGVNVLVGHACLCGRPSALGQLNRYVQAVGVDMRHKRINIIGRIIVLAKHLNVGKFLVDESCRGTGVNQLHGNSLGNIRFGVGNGEGVGALVQLVSKIAIIEQPLSTLDNLDIAVVDLNSPSCPVTKRLNTNNCSYSVLAIGCKACSLKDIGAQAGQSSLIGLIGVPLIDCNSTVGSCEFTAILSSIGHVTGNGGNGLIPTGKGVLNTISSRLSGGNGTNGSLTVLVGLSLSAATRYPSYGILIHSSIELCSIGHVAGNGNNFLIPTLEGIGVLSSCGLSGCLAGVIGNSIVLPFAGLNGIAVAIHKGDGVLVNGIGRLDGHIVCGHLGGNSSIPARKSITGSGRINRSSNSRVVILRQSSNYVIVPVNEGDRVLVNSPLCIDGYVFVNFRGDFLIPACKGVTRLGRIGDMRHGIALVNLNRMKRIVTIVPSYGVNLFANDSGLSINFNLLQVVRNLNLRPVDLSGGNLKHVARLERCKSIVNILILGDRTVCTVNCSFAKVANKSIITIDNQIHYICISKGNRCKFVIGTVEDNTGSSATTGLCVLVVVVIHVHRARNTCQSGGKINVFQLGRVQERPCVDMHKTIIRKSNLFNDKVFERALCNTKFRLLILTRRNLLEGQLGHSGFLESFLTDISNSPRNHNLAGQACESLYRKGTDRGNPLFDHKRSNLLTSIRPTANRFCAAIVIVYNSLRPLTDLVAPLAAVVSGGLHNSRSNGQSAISSQSPVNTTPSTANAGLTSVNAVFVLGNIVILSVAGIVLAIDDIQVLRSSQRCAGTKSDLAGQLIAVEIQSQILINGNCFHVICQQNDSITRLSCRDSFCKSFVKRIANLGNQLSKLGSNGYVTLNGIGEGNFCTIDCPVSKVVAFLSGVGFGSGNLCTIINLSGLNSVAVTIYKGYGILIHSSREGCDVSHIACNLGNSLIPTLKGVGVLRGCSLGGSCTRVRRNSTVCNLAGLQLGAVLVLKGHSVLVYSAIKLSSIGHCTGNGNNFLIPTLKGIGILRSCSLGGSCTRVRRNSTVLNLAGLNGVAVAVNEGYGVLINSAIELSSIGCCAGNGNNFLIPTLKDIGTLRSCSLGGSCARVLRNSTVLNLGGLNGVAVAVNEGNRILLYHSIISSGVYSLTGNGVDLGVPTGEGVAGDNVAVGIDLVRLGCSGSHDLISGGSVGVGLFRQHRAIVVLEGYVVDLNLPNHLAGKGTGGSKPSLAAICYVVGNSVGIDLALNRVQGDGQTCIRLDVGTCAIGYVDRIQNRGLKVIKRVLRLLKGTERDVCRFAGFLRSDVGIRQSQRNDLTIGRCRLNDLNLQGSGGSVCGNSQAILVSYSQKVPVTKSRLIIQIEVARFSCHGIDPNVNIMLQSISAAQNSLNNVVLQIVELLIIITVQLQRAANIGKRSGSISHLNGIAIIICNGNICGVNTVCPLTITDKSSVNLNLFNVHCRTVCSVEVGGGNSQRVLTGGESAVGSQSTKIHRTGTVTCGLKGNVCGIRLCSSGNGNGCCVTEVVFVLRNRNSVSQSCSLTAGRQSLTRNQRHSDLAFALCAQGSKNSGVDVSLGREGYAGVGVGDGGLLTTFNEGDLGFDRQTSPLADTGQDNLFNSGIFLICSLVCYKTLTEVEVTQTVATQGVSPGIIGSGSL